MKFIQHKTNNQVLGAPKDWDQSAVECGALPVTVAEHHGQPVIMSFWTPDVAELAAIAAGHPIVLIVYGNSMPPVSIDVAREKS